MPGTCWVSINTRNWWRFWGSKPLFGTVEWWHTLHLHHSRLKLWILECIWGKSNSYLHIQSSFVSQIFTKNFLSNVQWQKAYGLTSHVKLNMLDRLWETPGITKSHGWEMLPQVTPQWVVWHGESVSMELDVHPVNYLAVISIATYPQTPWPSGHHGQQLPSVEHLCVRWRVMTNRMLP